MEFIFLESEADDDEYGCHPFMKSELTRKIRNGILLFAKVCIGRHSMSMMYHFDNDLVCKINQDILSRCLPVSWTQRTATTGFEYRILTGFLAGSEGAYVKSDIPIEKYGPLWHGCRLLTTSILDKYNYGYYDATNKVIKLKGYPVKRKCVKSLKNLCVQVFQRNQNPLRIVGKTMEKIWNCSRLPSSLHECLQKYMDPAEQMAQPKCFKTVKVWHANQEICQEIEYDAETRKYHGKARMWDFRGRLILELHFHQGQMHGPCVTMDPEAGGFPTSLTVFKHNVPTGERIRFNLAEDCKQTTQFQLGSCSHRIRFRTATVYDDGRGCLYSHSVHGASGGFAWVQEMPYDL